MYCKLVKNTRYYVMLLFVGVVLATFGIINQALLSESANNMSRVMGIFTGMGSAFVGVAIIKLVHQKRTSPEKLREEEIELKDERNVSILRNAYTTSSVAASIMFAILVILFSAIGSVMESYICLAALLIQQGVFLIAHRYYSKKM